MEETELTLPAVRKLITRLSALERDREGVAMYLVLEDRADAGEPAAPFGPEERGVRLAELAEVYGTVLEDEGTLEDEALIAATLEVLAAAHFTRRHR